VTRSSPSFLPPLPSLRQLLALPQAYPLSWSPDGATLLVASDIPGTRQLFSLPAQGGEMEQLTDYAEPVSGFYLPDGRVLLEIDESGNERTQLHILGEGTLVSDPRFNHWTPHISKDGRRLAYTTNRRNGRDFDIVVREFGSGDEKAFEIGGYIGVDSISPDGAWVVAVRGNELAGDTDVLLIDVEAGSVEHITPHEGSAEFGGTVWDGYGFYASGNDGRDRLAISRFDLGTREWTVVRESRWDIQCFGGGERLVVVANEDGYSRSDDLAFPGDGVADHFVFSSDGAQVAFGFSTTTEPQQVWVHDFDTGESRKLTDLGRVEAGVEPSLHRFESFDGESIPVFLFTPPGDGPFPVVVTIHGGPEAQWQPWYSSGFGAFTQHLVSRGYAVAAPNVRGSSGYGKRFQSLDDVEKRLDSVADLASLHAWLAGRPEIDGDRQVVYGRSYGGYMVLAALAFQPELWAAGLECVGISSLRTFLENTSDYRRAVREREYGSLSDPELLDRLSPWSRLDAIRAPLFIEHGRNDPRVPVSESEAIHAELVGRGVRCELVIYEDEGHTIDKLPNRIDCFERMVAFLDETLA
jgi:dipeptidyl aminopeptidase/acylaminoacyl peptidase